MRRPRNPNPIAPPQFELGRHMRKRTVSQAEVLKRLEFVENCLVLGMTQALIYKACRKPPPDGLGIGQTAAANYIKRVRERWIIEAEANRATNKVEAVQRLMTHMRQARQDRKWAAVAAFERLISDIQGTREPLRVDVNMNLNVALMQVIGNLTGEQRDTMLAEYEEMEEKAQLAETLALAPARKGN